MANESQEMYLKTILLLHLRNKSARSVDVANELGYSKASVSRAVGILKDEDYKEAPWHLQRRAEKKPWRSTINISLSKML